MISFISMFNIVKNFITEDIWRLTKNDLGNKKFLLIKTSRVLILAVREFLKDSCKEKASALTYYSLMSIVPLIAMAFGIAKGFGFESVLQEQISKSFYGREEVASYLMTFADTYLSSIKGGVIAGVGFALLLWTVMNVLGNTEQSFNDIWKVKRSRTIVRKFSDYISIMLIGILFLVSSGSAIVYVSNMFNDVFLIKHVWVVITAISPLILVWIVFSLLFFILPNTKVKFTSALAGGMVSGTIFLIVQFLYICFQVGMSKNNAIYGSFAAFPLLLIWMQMSWYIVLFGAEISYAVQNVKSYEFDSDVRKISVYSRRIAYIRVANLVAIRFVNRKTAATAADLSNDLRLPLTLVYELLFTMVDAKILSEVRTANSEVSGYQPAFDINNLTVIEFLSILDHYGVSDIDCSDSKQYVSLIEEFHETLYNLPNNKLLKDI